MLVLSTSPGFARHGSVPKRLAATGWEFVRCLEPGEIEARIGEADFIVARLLPVTAAHLAAAPRLKGVPTASRWPAGTYRASPTA